jgi:hypothetical protein
MKAQFEYFKILIINDKYTSLLLYIELICVATQWCGLAFVHIGIIFGTSNKVKVKQIIFSNLPS